jgi:hypothetical protein
LCVGVKKEKVSDRENFGDPEKIALMVKLLLTLTAALISSRKERKRERGNPVA